MANSESATPWGRYELEPGQSESIRIGPLRLDLRREKDEFWVGRARTAGEDDPAEATEWERWVAPADVSAITVKPALPDRTLVVAPEVAFHVMPTAEARVYVRVPLVAQILMDDSSLLLEVPSLVMSNTWWGDFVDGELCLWLPTTGRRALEDHHFQSHLVVCPVNIENTSPEVLRIEGSAVRVAHLSVFGDGGRLWADETRVRFSGHKDGSEIDISGEPPPEAPEAVLISPPRLPLHRGVRARTFAKLRSLSGL